jgi:hypothetical protein
LREAASCVGTLVTALTKQRAAPKRHSGLFREQRAAWEGSVKPREEQLAALRGSCAAFLGQPAAQDGLHVVSFPQPAAPRRSLMLQDPSQLHFLHGDSTVSPPGATSRPRSSQGPMRVRTSENQLALGDLLAAGLVARSCGAARAAQRWCRSATSPRGKGAAPRPLFPWRSCRPSLSEAAVRAEPAEPAGRCRALASASVVSTAATLPRKTSSDPGRKPIHLLGPFRRNRTPARSSQCSMLRLASPTDASLSAPRSWHVDRDSEPAAWRAAGELAARLGRRRLRAEQNRDAAQLSTAGRTAALDHTGRKGAAARDTAHKQRPESSPNALGSDRRFLDTELTV